MTARLLILTCHPHLHAPRRMAEAAAAQGLLVEFVTPATAIAVAARLATERRSEHGAPGSALLLARPGTFSLLPVLRSWRRLVVAGATPLQSRRALWTACDQWRTLVAAERAGIAVPTTLLIRRPDAIERALASVGGSTWYLKGRRGSQGSHVERAADPSTALRIGQRYWGIGQSFLVQADRREHGPIERHLVCAGRVIASARADACPGEHRSNAHRGGRFTPLLGALATAAPLACAAVAAVGLPFAAVDAIGGPRPELLEVNASPGLDAIERATGRDLAAELMASLLQSRLMRQQGRSSPPLAHRAALRGHANAATADS